MSQPAGWAEVMGQLPLRDLGAPGGPWEPFPRSARASAGGDLGNLREVLASRFTDEDTETLEGKRFA